MVSIKVKPKDWSSNLQDNQKKNTTGKVKKSHWDRWERSQSLVLVDTGASSKQSAEEVWLTHLAFQGFSLCKTRSNESVTSRLEKKVNARTSF